MSDGIIFPQAFFAADCPMGRLSKSIWFYKAIF